jgi:hypothetical protein
MKLFFTKLFYCSCVLLMPFFLQAQTKFIASVSPSQAGKDEYITLTLSVENGNNVQQISHPDFTDFNVVSGPNQSSSMMNVNGVVTQTISLSYILQAKKPGNFTIAACTAIADGKSYKSNAVKVLVSNQKSNKPQQQTNNSPFAGMDVFDEPAPQKIYDDYILRNGETVQDKVSKNMHLKAQTDKTVCFVGEPIIATYKLYTRLQSESILSKNPSFNGFSVIDMVQGMNRQSDNKHEILDGREYNVYEIRKAQLYPLMAGDFTLETATLDNKLSFVKYDNGAGNYGTNINETVSLSSKPLNVKVKPLPDAGKPENFSGAVGNFTIEAAVEKKIFSTDEMGKLKITIEGKGNMQLLTAPEIQWAKGFEVFEAKVADNTDAKTIPVSGSKTFEIPFAVTDTGATKISPIQFSFFDPTTGTYKTVSSTGIILQITKGTGKPISEVLAIQKTKPTSFFNDFFKHRWMIISLIIGIIFISLIFWFKKEKKKETLVEKKKEEEKVIIAETKNEVDLIAFSNKNHLQKTENCLTKDDCNDFYTHLNFELKTFLAVKFSMNKEDVNSKTVSLELEKSNLDNATIVEATQLMQEIELQLYTPFERTEKIKEVYSNAQTIIQQLNKAAI